MSLNENVFVFERSDDMTNENRWISDAIDFAVGKVKENAAIFKQTVPPAASVQLQYIPEDNIDWTASFWIGMLLLSKEYSQTKEFDETIQMQLQSFKNRLDNKVGLETHDIGFLYSLSAVADYRLTGSETSKQMIIQAADELLTRYSEKAEIIQAWGNLNDPEQQGRMIIDCLMNLPLLYVASRLTGNQKYYQAAYKHAKKTQKYIVRYNATTYHTYYFDIHTGEAKYGKTQQGYSDDSCWARGQAWGIYGFTLSYLYTGDYTFLETAMRVADYFISHLPEDKIVYWDLIFDDASGEEKDSSASAIAACGLLELAKQLPLSDDKREKYEKAAIEMMQTLSATYTTKGIQSNGILLHGVYDKKGSKGVDECMIWGDYFYLEALIRLAQYWYRYW